MQEALNNMYLITLVLTSPLFNRLSQQSKKYFANISLGNGFPLILILSLTSIKCGELGDTSLHG